MEALCLQGDMMAVTVMPLQLVASEATKRQRHLSHTVNLSQVLATGLTTGRTLLLYNAQCCDTQCESECVFPNGAPGACFQPAQDKLASTLDQCSSLAASPYRLPLENP